MYVLNLTFPQLSYLKCRPLHSLFKVMCLIMLIQNHSMIGITDRLWYAIGSKCHLSPVVFNCISAWSRSVEFFVSWYHSKTPIFLAAISVVPPPLLYFFKTTWSQTWQHLLSFSSTYVTSLTSNFFLVSQTVHANSPITLQSLFFWWNMFAYWSFFLTSQIIPPW